MKKIIRKLVAPLLDYLGVLRVSDNGAVHGGQVTVLSHGRTPRRATDLDAGFDVFTPDAFVLHPGETRDINSGLRFILPKHVFLRVDPKSGLAVKYRIHKLAGIVDSGYRGEVVAILTNLGHTPALFNAGDKICQLVPTLRCDMQLLEVDEAEFTARSKVAATERGQGGFGSTGR